MAKFHSQSDFEDFFSATFDKCVEIVMESKKFFVHRNSFQTIIFFARILRSHFVPFQWNFVFFRGEIDFLSLKVEKKTFPSKLIT